jgi:hypothetical protein
LLYELQMHAGSLDCEVVTVRQESLRWLPVPYYRITHPQHETYTLDIESVVKQYRGLTSLSVREFVADGKTRDSDLNDNDAEYY